MPSKYSFNYAPLEPQEEFPKSSNDRHCFTTATDDNTQDDNQPQLNKVSRENTRVRVLLFAVCLPWSLVIGLSLIVYWHAKNPSETACTRKLNPYSPVIEDGIIEYYDTNFENGFAHGTKYRGPPTPELEEAWDELWNRGSIEVPLDGVVRLNKSNLILKHTQSNQSRGYDSILEVFHQLHCLNLIRQYTWKDYYNEHLREWLQAAGHDGIVDLNVTDPKSVGDRMHVDHCIETLRLQLMCNADVTPMLIVVDDSSALGSAADFDTHHKCRNWDKLMEWQDEHNIGAESA